MSSSKSTVHRRKGTTASATRYAGQQSKGSKASNSVTDAKQLTSALQQAKNEAVANGISEEEFKQCVRAVSKQLKLQSPGPNGRGSSHCRWFKIIFKVVWMLFLMLLALGLMSAAFKPVMFYMHKVSTSSSRLEIDLHLPLSTRCSTLTCTLSLDPCVLGWSLFYPTSNILASIFSTKTVLLRILWLEKMRNVLAHTSSFPQCSPSTAHSPNFQITSSSYH